MLDVLIARFKQGHHTMKFPDGPPPPLPERFAGKPEIFQSSCKSSHEECIKICPTGAIQLKENKTLQLDMGKCIFCRKCENECNAKCISFSNKYSLSTQKREDLIITSEIRKNFEIRCEKARKYFSSSLKLREISAGGCNACEADTNVLSTLAWDLGRFGIEFVASPRHADGIVVTGPVTENMRKALIKTYEAVPEPKIVIAIGTCAISGGPYINHRETHNGISEILPVDLFIPGCPPHPLTILDGLLRLTGKIA